MQGWLVKFVLFRLKHPYVFSDELITQLNEAAANANAAPGIMDDVLASQQQHHPPLHTGTGDSDAVVVQPACLDPSHVCTGG